MFFFSVSVFKKAPNYLFIYPTGRPARRVFYPAKNGAILCRIGPSKHVLNPSGVVWCEVIGIRRAGGGDTNTGRQARNSLFLSNVGSSS